MVNFPSKDFQTQHIETIITVISGLLFLVIFYIAYQVIPENYYRARDDGIITMSHARNLVEYGVIGINPSGERVEGFSAPAQFFLYSLIYTIHPIHYVTYGMLQALVGGWLLGYMFARFFHDHKWSGLVFSLAAAVFLATSSSFIEWHGSGMENAITHVLFLATLLLLYEMVRNKEVNLLFAIPIFLATITRIESIFHIGPLLALFSVFWLFYYRSFTAFWFSCVVFMLWVGFQAWRYFYFADLLPNTANAQSISVLDNLHQIFQDDSSFFTTSKFLATSIVRNHGGFVLAVFLPLLLFVKYNRGNIFLFAMLLSLVGTAIINPFVFGQTRLDETRSTTHLAVVVVLFASLLVYWTRNRRALIILLPIILTTAVYLSGYGTPGADYQRRPPYYVCCDKFTSEYPRQEFIALKIQHDLKRPTVANPDLGAVSWHKEFNILDLGLLGNRIIGQLDNAESADYLFDFAAPDFIELHHAWSEFYDYVIKDERFSALYEPVRERWEPCRQCKNKEKLVLNGLWVRKAIKAGAPSEERKLIEQLAEAPSLGPIRGALSKCQVEATNPAHCQYVTRSAYRHLPEFRAQGLQDDLIALFANTPSAAYDQSLLSGFYRGDWYREAVAYLQHYRKRKNRIVGNDSSVELRKKKNPTNMRGKW